MHQVKVYVYNKMLNLFDRISYDFNRTDSLAKNISRTQNMDNSIEWKTNVQVELILYFVYNGTKSFYVVLSVI